MSISVRPAVLSDAPTLYRAWQSIRQHYADMDRRIVQVPVTETEFTAGLRETLARPAAATFVAERGGAFVGFVSAGVEANQPDRLPERHATIGYLFVAPEVRRQGTGRALFDAVAAWARECEGVSHVEMPVLADDSSARAFWTALGFRPFIERLWAPLEGVDDSE